MRFGRSLFLLLVLVLAFGAPLNAQDQKSITVSWLQEPDNLNPMYTTMTFAGYTYQLFLAPAWSYDGDLNPFPVLVEEMPSTSNGGISEDGTTFTLKLKEGLTWSDGDPLDSADFIFTHDMITNPANTPLSISPYDLITSIEAPDAQTVVFSFDEPYAPWLTLWSWVLPEHVLRPVFDAEGTLDNAEFNRAPSVASGPYVLETWDFGNFARFTANPNYVLGEPNIDVVVVTFVPDDQTYVANLSQGTSDIGTFIPPDEAPSLEEQGLRVEIIPSGYNEGWFFNAGSSAHPALQDVRVRKAIALGFDRGSVVEDLLLGVLPTGASYWENTPYANPDIEPVPYDPDQARELLDEAGWVQTGDPLIDGGDGLRAKDGEELRIRFITNTRGIRMDIQAVAQQQLGLLGIDVILENYESNVFFNGYADGGPAALGEYEIAEWSSSPAFPDPDTTRFMCGEIPTDEFPSGGNWNYYCDPALDELFTAQQSATNFEDRVAIFHEIDQMIYDAYIWVAVWHDADIWVVNPRIENANINGVTPFWDVQNWDVAN